MSAPQASSGAPGRGCGRSSADAAMTSIVGHAEATAAFQSALSGGVLHHAWLLAGPPGVGKGSFAQEAAIALLGDTPRNRAMVAAGSHPDYLLLKREVWTSASPPRI